MMISLVDLLYPLSTVALFFGFAVVLLVVKKISNLYSQETQRILGALKTLAESKAGKFSEGLFSSPSARFSSQSLACEVKYDSSRLKNKLLIKLVSPDSSWPYLYKDEIEKHKNADVRDLYEKLVQTNTSSDGIDLIMESNYIQIYFPGWIIEEDERFLHSIDSILAISHQLIANLT